MGTLRRPRSTSTSTAARREAAAASIRERRKTSTTPIEASGCRLSSMDDERENQEMAKCNRKLICADRRCLNIDYDAGCDCVRCGIEASIVLNVVVR
jgi:hypothetical protein